MLAWSSITIVEIEISTILLSGDSDNQEDLEEERAAQEARGGQQPMINLTNEESVKSKTSKFFKYHRQTTQTLLCVSLCFSKLNTGYPTVLSKKL